MAYGEMYMVIASLVRRVKMELYETSVDCVDPWRDHLIVVPRNTDGVRAVVKAVDME